MILYRPVGLPELELIYDGGMTAFPARLPQQPIFYPVLQLEYARQIASDWNTKSGQSAGYVTQFKVEDDYIEHFEKHMVGGSQHQEFWIPAEEVDEFNKHIVGHIKVVEAHFGDAFQGFVPEKFGLQGKNVVEQFTLLTNSYLYKRMDFYLEIKRNHKAIFLNYPFWLTYDFKNPGLKKKIVQAIKEAWFTSFPQFPLANPVSVDIVSPQETDAESLGDVIEGDVTAEQTDSHPVVHLVPEPVALVKQPHSLSLTNPAPEPTAPSKGPDIHLRQGLDFGLSGKFHEAIDELSRVVQEDPGLVIARTSLGVAFHRVGEDDRAISAYEAALNMDPKYAEAHYFRANILYSRGNVREAIAGYTVAIGLDPELIDAHQRPIPQDRLTEYTSSPAEIYSIAKPAQRILDLNKLLETDPKHANLFKERAAEYYRLRNYEQAIADYSSYLATQPGDANALHLRGVAYEESGHSDQALRDYRQASASNPQLSDMYIDRGITLGKMRNFRQSIASLTEGIRLAPRNPIGYFNRGMTYFQQGDFERAIEDFSGAIQFAAKDEAAYYWRGVSYEEVGRQHDAIADYRQFLALSQDADARDAIEQKLSQWNDENRITVTDERQETDPIASEKQDPVPDLYDLIVALGKRAIDSAWVGSGVVCYGEKAEELISFVDQNRPIDGQDLLRIAAGIDQTFAGDFAAFDPGATAFWFFIRAWDGSGFYIEINDPNGKERLKAQFQSIEEVDGASPPYEGLFLHI